MLRPFAMVVGGPQPWLCRESSTRGFLITSEHIAVHGDDESRFVVLASIAGVEYNSFI